MHYTLIATNESIVVVGMVASITNLATAHEDIGQLWHLFALRVNEIVHTVDGKLYCIYTGYSEGGCYSCIIGKQVSTTAKIPDGMVSIKIPADCYALYAVNGQMPQAIVTFWKEFWSTEHDYTRSFNVDYEVYSETDDQAAKVYISRICP